MDKQGVKSEVRLTHGVMSGKCQSNSDTKRPQLYCAFCFAAHLQNMENRCGVKYSLSKLYDQFNDIQGVRYSCLNETGCLKQNKTSV